MTHLSAVAESGLVYAQRFLDSHVHEVTSALFHELLVLPHAPMERPGVIHKRAGVTDDRNNINSDAAEGGRLGKLSKFKYCHSAFAFPLLPLILYTHVHFASSSIYISVRVPN